MKYLWKDCLSCKNKCCEIRIISYKLFLTPEEKDTLSNINSGFPCIFYKNKICSIHEKRPVDCRLFPFDILEKNNKFFWIVWKLNCPISNKRNFEPYLQEHERNIIPEFKNYLSSYSKWKFEEIKKVFQYEVLRKVRI